MSASPSLPAPLAVDDALAVRLRGAVLDAHPSAVSGEVVELAIALGVYLTRKLASPPPRIVGIAGAQGSGKSTLCAMLTTTLSALGFRAATLSIDDLYLTRAERRRLAATVHPLLATRGVPGTHDVAMGLEVMDAVAARREVDLPRFDKGRDDRRPRGERVDDVDYLLFEGWCVGVSPQASDALATPVNALEREEDPDGKWRRYVNDRIGDYQPLFDRLDLLVWLEVPGMEAVTRWRSQQEQELPPEQRMSDADLGRFVQHYERLTRHMLQSMDVRADVKVVLEPDHSLGEVTLRSESIQ